MTLSRRDVLRGGGFAAALGLGLVPLSACGSDEETGSSTAEMKETALWYWGGGLSDAVVTAAVQQFKAKTTIKPSLISGDFKAKLQTTFTGRQFVPQITGVKGEDMPYFLSVANRFVDLNELGAKDLVASGLEWKWKEAQDKSGKQIGYPIDIGPTAMFYRADIFEQAGLPVEPAAVGDAVKTWDDFYALGTELHGKVPASFPVLALGTIWDLVICQTSQRFVDEDNTFVGDSDEMHQAWQTTVKAQQLGLNANSSQSRSEDLTRGKAAVTFGAAWFALDLENEAPKTAGKWRVANNPDKPGNQGGSFLTIPTGTANPALAFEIIKWILSTDNEAKSFEDAKIFPADPAAWDLPALTGGSAFFGGQKTIEIFGPAGKLVPAQYRAPSDGAIYAPYADELTKVETAGKDPEQAWKDAVAAAKQVAERQGVS